MSGLPDEIWLLIAESLPVVSGFLVSRTCKSLRLALLKHRCQVVCVPFYRAPTVELLILRLKPTGSSWPKEPLLLQLSPTNHKLKLNSELFESIVSDLATTLGWAAIRRHLEQPFYGRFGLPEKGTCISLAENVRLNEERLERKRRLAIDVRRQNEIARKCKPMI